MATPFEHGLQGQLIKFGWKCKRLGGTSIEFPDLVAVNKKHSELLAVECKAYSSDKIYIPIDQYHRCFDVCDMFDLYENRFAVFAFKFNRIVKRRPTKFYFGIINHKDYDNSDVRIICDYKNGIKNQIVSVGLDHFNRDGAF